MTAPEPYYEDESVRVFLGDCLDVLRTLEADSIDAIVTDPPYGLEFMGKKWDSFGRDTGNGYREKPRMTADHMGKGFKELPNHFEAGRPFQRWCEAWAIECLRVLKPGGHLLAFGGTRTWHRMVCAIEDAGFEIRDSISWIYGNGFPKSLSVSAAIDKAAGVEREIVGPKMRPDGRSMLDARGGDESRSEGWDSPWRSDPDAVAANGTVTAPATEDAARWCGWGTALKPAHEPIVVARKPLAAGTVAANVLAFGTGALNIDGCRVDGGSRPARTNEVSASGLTGTGGAVAYGSFAVRGSIAVGETTEGRWPSNVLLAHSADCEPAGMRKVRNHGHSPAARGAGGIGTSGHKGQDGLTELRPGTETIEAWDCAAGCPVAEMDRQTGVLTSGANPTRRKSDKFRDAYGEFAGQEECTPHRGTDTGGASRFFPVFRYETKAAAHERPRLKDGTAHPTVKPVDLMSWLVRLVTPPGGTVLDPFGGSGTTAEACIVEGFRCVLIEQDPAYAELIKTRLRKPIQPTMFGMEAS